MSIEVSTNFDKVLKEAKEIKTNVRLVETIKKWESEEHIEIQEKIELGSQGPEGLRGASALVLRATHPPA